MDIKINAGNCDILSNGSVICMDNFPIVFTFGQLSFKILLHKNENGKDGKPFTMDIDDENNIAILNLYLKDAYILGTGTPYSVGKVNGRILMFSFHINAFSILANKNDTPLVLNYMWMLKNDEGDDEK